MVGFSFVNYLYFDIFLGFCPIFPLVDINRLSDIQEETK